MFFGDWLRQVRTDNSRRWMRKVGLAKRVPPRSGVTRGEVLEPRQLQTVLVGGVSQTDYYNGTTYHSGATYNAGGAEQGFAHQSYDAQAEKLAEAFDAILSFFPQSTTVNLNAPMTVAGTNGDDQIITGFASDDVKAGLGNDEVFTSTGNDKVDLGGGNDKAFTGKGNDTALGGAGNDEIHTGSGNDSLDGGTGNDILDGGSGHDKYQFSGSFGFDAVIDSSSTGELKFSGQTLENLQFRQNGSNLEIRTLDVTGRVTNGVQFRDYYAHPDRSGWTLTAQNGSVRVDTMAHGNMSEMAQLAINSYDDRRLTPPAGYSLVHTIDDARSGLNATIYQQNTVNSETVKWVGPDGTTVVNVKTATFTPRTGTAIVAVRGTTFTDPRDVSADLEILDGADTFADEFGKQSELLKQDIRSYLATHNVGQVTIVGHSLGYAVGQNVLVDMARERPDVNFNLIGFNGPGIAQFTPSLQHALPPNASITLVVNENDIVSKFGEQHPQTIVQVIPGGNPLDVVGNHKVEPIQSYLNSHGGQLPPATSLTEQSTGAHGIKLRTLEAAAVRDGAQMPELPAFPLMKPESVKRFDMGTATSAVTPGWTQVTGSMVYSSATGWGWQKAVKDMDRGKADDLLRDFVTGSQMDFVVDLPNGSYDVTLTVGDRGELRQSMQVQLDGYAMETLTTSPGQFLNHTFRANVVDGQLRLSLTDLGGLSTNAVLNALEITRVDPQAPMLLNQQIAKDPVIVVLTHGFTLQDWITSAVKIFGDVIETIKDTANFIVSASHGDLVDATLKAIELAGDINKIQKKLNDSSSPVSNWVFEMASSLSRMVRQQGVGALDPNVVPIEIKDINHAETDEQILKLWKGSQDFLSIDWTDESNDGVGLLDFNEHEHRQAEFQASTAIVRALEARVHQELAKNPDAKVDVLFIGHGFGGSVNREAMDKLNKSEIAKHLDFVKVVSLDPIAMKPDSDPNEASQQHDRFYWFHPELTGALDAVDNYFQTQGLAPTGILEGRLIGWKPLDDKLDGGALGFTNRQGRVWDITTGQEVIRFRHLAEDDRTITSGQIRDILYSSDGKYIVSVGGDAQIKIRYAKTGDEIGSIDGHFGTVRDAALLGSDYLVTISADKSVQIARLSDATIVSAANHGNASQVAVSADGRFVATAGKDDEIRVWKVIRENGSVRLESNFQSLRDHKMSLNVIAFDPANGNLVAAGNGKNLFVYQLNGERFSLTQKQALGAVANKIEFGAGQLIVASGSQVSFWKIQDGKYQATGQVLKDHVADVHGLAVSFDGKRLATGGEDHTIFVYDLATMQKINTLNAAMLPIKNLAFNADGTQVAACYQDNPGGPVRDQDITGFTDKYVQGWFGFFKSIFTGDVFGAVKGKLSEEIIRHARVPDVYIEHVVDEGRESFFVQRDNPRVSRPGDLEFANTRPGTDQGSVGGSIDPTMPNEFPVEVISKPTDHTLARPETLALAGLFRDKDGGPLQFTATSSNNAAVLARIVSDGTNFSALLTPASPGEATITLTATDGKNTATVTFHVSVADDTTAIEQRVAELKQQAKQLADDIATKTKAAGVTQDKLDRAIARAEEALADYNAFAKQVATLKKNLDAESKKLADLQAKRQPLLGQQTAKQQQLAPLEQQLIQLALQISVLKQQIQPKADRVSAIEQRVKTINDNLPTAKGDRKDRLLAERKTLNDEKSDLNSSLTRLRSDRDGAVKSQTQTENSAKPLRSDLKSLGTKLTDLDKKITDQQAVVQSLQDRMNGETGKLADANQKLDRAVQLRHEWESELTDLSHWSATADQSINDMLTEVQNLRERKLSDEKLGLQKFNDRLLSLRGDENALKAAVAIPTKKLERADATIAKAQAAKPAT